MKKTSFDFFQVDTSPRNGVVDVKVMVNGELFVFKGDGRVPLHGQDRYYLNGNAFYVSDRAMHMLEACFHSPVRVNGDFSNLFFIYGGCGTNVCMTKEEAEFLEIEKPETHIKLMPAKYLMNTDNNGLDVVKEVPLYIEVDENVSAIVSDVIRGIVRYAMPLNIKSLHALMFELRREIDNAPKERDLYEKLTDKELARIDSAIDAVYDLIRHWPLT
ncbi:MAG: hypothetical protein ACRCWB_11820 [Enterovibrio sp.]